MLEQLKDQILVVVEARDDANLATSIREVSYQKWVKANEGLLNTESLAKLDRDTAEAKLRELTLQAYAETGDKAPMVGVGIREVTKLDYDKEVAFKWATEHVMALKLDTTAFEKIVKASPLDFVFQYLEPQATIATQLEVVD